MMVDHADALCSRAEVVDKSDAVRKILKDWEKAFSDANGGNKASNKDIKQNEYIGKSHYLYDCTSCSSFCNLIIQSAG